MSEAIVVGGFAELVANLRDLAPNVQRSVLRPAARAGTKAPRQRLKRTAPRRSGALRKAIISKVSTSKDKMRVTGTVGASRKFVVATKNKKGRLVSGIKQVAKHAANIDAIQTIRPSKYAHLAGPKRTADYMADAQQATQSQTLSDFTSRAKIETDKVARRMAAKKKR